MSLPFSVALGPMPDTMSICGDWNAPADKITSLFADTTNRAPAWSTSTPVAVLFASNRIRFAMVSVYTTISVVNMASFRKLVWDESRWLFVGLMVLVTQAEPLSWPLLKLRELVGRPRAFKPFKAQDANGSAQFGQDTCSGPPRLLSNTVGSYETEPGARKLLRMFKDQCC